MNAVIVVLAIVTVLSGLTEASYQNKFEATRGCLQYNSYQGYHYPHPYVSTGSYRNVRRFANNTTEFRFGILGKNDGILRLAPVQYPYDRTIMNEIVLAGWAGTKSSVRRYVRTSPSNPSSAEPSPAEQNANYSVLLSQSALNLMSQFEPLMFTMTVHPNGLVKLTQDGDTFPFLEFRDQTLSVKYIGFCNYDVPVIFFFDCPPYR